MQARRTLMPGQKGTKKFLDRFGKELFCVRYRYDEKQGKRFTTVELIVEQSAWTPPTKPTVVGLRVELKETDLQRRIKQAGGKWNRDKGVWEISYDQALALDLKNRIVKVEVSKYRH